MFPTGLLASHTSDIVQDALKRYLASSWQASYSTILEGFIISSTTRIRLLVAKILSLTYDNPTLEQLLDRYIGLATYYYDVVVIFDEALYGASPFVERNSKTGAGEAE